MWPIIWNEEDEKWEVGEFSRQNLVDSSEDLFYFQSDAEFECLIRNVRLGQSPNVPFWQEAEV